MPYNKKGRFQNNIHLSNNAQKEIIDFTNAPKSEHYRDVLEPFINTCIEITGQFEKINYDKKQNYVLLKNIKIKKVPAKVRSYVSDDEIDHMYIAVSKDFSKPNQKHICLKARGFIYQYLSQNKKNIGMQAVTIKQL